MVSTLHVCFFFNTTELVEGLSVADVIFHPQPHSQCLI